jgi:hypothetical protein
MARDTFRDIGHLLDAICGSVLDSPLGHLLGDYMMALEGRLPAVTESDFPHVTKAVSAMVAAAVEPSAARVAIAERQMISAARNGSGRRSAGICEPRPWGRKISRG